MICGLFSYWEIVLVLWSLVEFWLGKTDRVKSGSTLELLLNTMRFLIQTVRSKKSGE